LRNQFQSESVTKLFECGVGVGDMPAPVSAGLVIQAIALSTHIIDGSLHCSSASFV
jgi:hypothetical protein